jgi:hypothetical protein
MDLLEKVERARIRERNLALNKKNRAERKRKREKHICCGDHGKIIIGNTTNIHLCPNTRRALTNRLLNKKYINNYMVNICFNCEL